MLIKKASSGWELHKIADGSLSCENFGLSADDIDTIKLLLKPKFEKSMQNLNIMVSFDNWSGVFIMHFPRYHTKSSDILIEKIYDYLSTRE